jgi:hypothetical protein
MVWKKPAMDAPDVGFEPLGIDRMEQQRHVGPNLVGVGAGIKQPSQLVEATMCDGGIIAPLPAAPLSMPKIQPDEATAATQQPSTATPATAASRHQPQTTG